MISNSAEIQSVLLAILKIGLLRIRAFGSDGLADQCSIEADHLHNLPNLIQTLRPEELSYYYNVERPAFLKQVTEAEQFQPHWNQLAMLIDSIGV